MSTCSWSGSVAPGAMRISTVASPLFASNSSVLVSQPGKRAFSHGRSLARTTCERLSSSGVALSVFGLTFIGCPPGRMRRQHSRSLDRAQAPEPATLALILPLDLGVLHDLGEFRRLGLDETLVFHMRHRLRHDALRGEVVGNRLILERRVDDVVEPGDDRLRRAGGDEDAEPVKELVALEARRALGERRDVGEL